MTKNRNILVTLVVLIAIACFIAAWIYFTHTAENLPHYFPGYTKGYAHIHAKHGIAAIIVGFAGLIFAWFQTGKKQPSASTKMPKTKDQQ